MGMPFTVAWRSFLVRHANVRLSTHAQPEWRARHHRTRHHPGSLLACLVGGMRTFQKLWAELDRLSLLVDEAGKQAPALTRFHPELRASAANLIDYLALR